MRFEVRHAMPGRLRLYVPDLGRRPALAQAAVAWLSRQEGVRSVRFNRACASLVVSYDRALEGTLRLLLGQLQLGGVADLARMVADPAVTGRDLAAPAGQAEKPPHAPRRIPLVLPTVSLALAFSTNPVVMGINFPLMLWNAFPIARRAFRVIRREKRLNVDFLDTLAIGASLMQGNPTAGAIVTWLIKLGDWIRDLTAAGSKRAVSELLEFQAKAAWVIRDGAVVSIPAVELEVGDMVVVHPGEMVPVDGEIVSGTALIDQKTITGEGLPVTRGAGEAAFAATVLREGQLTVRAVRVGAATTAGQIAALVDSAPIGDTRMQNHAERLADRLVAPTLALAVGTAALTRDFNRFLSLVIVDYGTGIRVAAPTSVLASMTWAARSGILIKSGRHMERLSQVDTVVFDKTGTLTHGQPAVLDVIPYVDAITPGHLLGLAAAAESRLTHPVAEALRTRANALQVNIPPCDETTYRLGMGVEGQVNGYYMHVGNRRFMAQSDIKVSASEADRAGLDERGFSCLYIAVDGKLAGLVPYADEIRPEASAVIGRLHQLGVKRTVMLTGDNAVVGRAVSRKLGLSGCYADLLPEDKASAVKEMMARGAVVAMIGDGINDSPALAHADVGIAMKHGAEVAHESADVVLMEDSLWKLAKAFEVSRGAVKLIKQNYAIVTGLNTLALGLALPGGLVTPEVTALISNGSAIFASLNGMRPALRRG